MAQFMFLIRGGDYSEVSPEQMGSVVQKYIDWSRSIRERGYSVTGDELEDHGTTLGPGGVVMDGLFSETKDIVGGYFLVDVPDKATAVSIAMESPNLGYGGYVEVKAIIEH